ncbi:hypothetical protein HELRODRAFT_181797 [Helobdella robusta]|uniref:Uncharacterized protein n=1 Tax=Helobdella robusta TaxID=6412 RepID=T1FHC3_HELRO|nr:hypothetical protein HELRODRAFT_181797 [Helobdella robusta]ESN92021.1 hypothetical protein HELRODRAFT_181797 [Helobdella robusta]
MNETKCVREDDEDNNNDDEDVENIKKKFKKSNEKTYENLDSVLVEIGQLGRYQKRLIFTVFMVSLSTAFNNMGYVFWAMRLDHNCTYASSWKHLITNATSSLAIEELMNRSTPWQPEDGGLDERSKCYQYKYNQHSNLFLNGSLV